MIFYILSVKHNNKISLRVGWKICCWYLVVTFLRMKCSLKLKLKTTLFQQFVHFNYKPVQNFLCWRIRDQLDVASYYVLFQFFYAQHFSDFNTSIIRSLQLFYCINTLIVCSCFDVCWSFGVAGLGWYPCSRLQPSTRIPPQHDQCGDTIEKSQASDDGCINVRNMLSIEEVK